MLVLSRKRDQTIYVGDARITITKIGKSRVLVGVDAPEDVPVVRGEIRKAEECRKS